MVASVHLDEVSGGQRGQVIRSDLGFDGGHDVRAGAGQDVEARIAAAGGPVVDLRGQNADDQPQMASPLE